MRQLAGISVRVCALTLLLSLACAGALLAQTARGELRIRVTDPAGLGVRTSVEISSEANQYRNTLATNEAGELNVARLPYGIYRVAVHQAGFADVDDAGGNTVVNCGDVCDPLAVAIGGGIHCGE